MELIREVERYIRSVKSENEYLRKTNSELEVLVSEIMKENKAYKKENERLRKYEELYLNHRAELDSD